MMRNFLILILGITLGYIGTNHFYSKIVSTYGVIDLATKSYYLGCLKANLDDINKQKIDICKHNSLEHKRSLSLIFSLIGGNE